MNYEIVIKLVKVYLYLCVSVCVYSWRQMLQCRWNGVGSNAAAMTTNPTPPAEVCHISRGVFFKESQCSYVGSVDISFFWLCIFLTNWSEGRFFLIFMCACLVENISIHYLRALGKENHRWVCGHSGVVFDYSIQRDNRDHLNVAIELFLMHS